MVEVFKTNITEVAEANLVIVQLKQMLTNARISFDLDDCDKILRVESQFIDCQDIVYLLKQLGYCCEILEH